MITRADFSHQLPPRPAAFLASCIMYIPYLSDMCLLLSALWTLGGVLMCSDSFGELPPALPNRTSYLFVEINGPKLFDTTVSEIVMN